MTHPSSVCREVHTEFDYLSALINEQLIRGPNPIFRLKRSGNCDSASLLDALVKLTDCTLVWSFAENGRPEHIGRCSSGTTFSLKKWDDEVELEFTSTNKGLVEKIEDLCARLITRKPPVGNVYVLVRTRNGYTLCKAGNLNVPLVRDNYQPTVAAGIDHAVGCMKSKEPCGRLVVLDGPPGTGKSYAIRHMATSVEAKFVLVAPSLVGEISGPDVVPVLLDGEGGKTDRIVLIMEDADAALVDRRGLGGSIDKLTEILNLGDGLLGELADVRVVATTNAGRVDLDKAVQRPGRLCRHISFSCLSQDEAAGIYRRLTGEACGFPLGGTSLAEVYMLARRDGWKPRKDPETGQYA